MSKENIWNGLIVFLLYSICLASFCWATMPVPLMGDQITFATIDLLKNNSKLFDLDPFWGQSPFLLYNLGVEAYGFFYEIFGSYEKGAAIALVIIFAAYMLTTYFVFTALSISPLLAFGITLLSTIPVNAPGATFWGIPSSGQFSARVLILPFIPLFLLWAVRLLSSEKMRHIYLFFLILGIACLIHPISCGYLFLSFITAFFLLKRISLYECLFSLVAFCIGTLPFNLVYGSEKLFLSSLNVYVSANSFYEIKKRFFAWAFDPAEVFSQFTSFPFILILVSIIIIAPICIRFGKEYSFIILGLGILASCIIPFLLQYSVSTFLDGSVWFIELWRGSRFLVFIAFVLFSFRLQALLLSAKKKLGEKVSLGLEVVIVLICVLAWMWTLSAKMFVNVTDSCHHEIFKTIKDLPSRSLLLTQNIHAVRYCSQKSVYADSWDNAIAFYNDLEAMIDLSVRLDKQNKFFESPTRNNLSSIFDEHPCLSHIISWEKLPNDKVWKEVSRSDWYYLYKINKSACSEEFDLIN